MFTSASHELRTPLNSVINSYALILNNLDTIIDTLNQNVHNLNKTKEIIDIEFSEIKRFIKIGKNSSTMLLLLIEDILDLAKMEAGTFKFNMTEFRISDITNEIHDIFVDQ